MAVLVTGTAGFIGYHLTKLLLEQGYEVVAIDNINDYYDVQLKLDRLSNLGVHITKGRKEYAVSDKFSFFHVDLEDQAGVETVFNKNQITHVVNLAAQAGVRYSLSNPRAYMRSNIDGFLNILECCRNSQPQVKHLIYASSSSVYGLNESYPFSTKDNVDHPISLYAASKKSNELMAHTYSHLFGIPTTGLRFFTVYGPWGRPDMALFIFTKALVANQPVQVYNHGNMLRDFTYVEDIVRSVFLLLDKPATPSPYFDSKNPDPSLSSAPYQVFNIGNNSPVKLMEFVRALEKNLNMAAKIEYMPMQPGDVVATYADVESLFNYIDYKPETTVAEGIEKFVEWYKMYYKI